MQITDSRLRVVALAAFAWLGFVFVLDTVMPQALVISVAYAVPVVLAVLTGSKRLTILLVIVAILGEAGGAVMDAAQNSFHWDLIGVENRLLSVGSLVLVAYLTLTLQAASERIGRLSAQRAESRRHAALSAAADRILVSLSRGDVVTAIAREASHALGATTAVWCPLDATDDFCVAQDGVAQVRAVEGGLPAQSASLLRRIAEGNAPEVVNAAEAVGFLLGDHLADRTAMAFPIGNRETTYGILLALFEPDAIDESVTLTATSFAKLASGALEQARLAAALAERNQSLQERQAVIQDLVDAISHDLRTPLTALSLALRQAGDGAYGALPDDFAAILREATISIDDICRLAETLLLVARFEAGTARSQAEPVRLDVMAGALASEFGAMAEARGVEIVTDLRREATAVGSRADLRRAFANLIANAIDHTPRGGTIEIGARRNGGHVDASVADDGYGVDARQRASLFQRFSRASEVGAGTGLGLYIVRRVAEAAGGTVRYEPRLPRGSLFVLSLPAAE
jgi:signal transduction histidine kinase